MIPLLTSAYLAPVHYYTKLMLGLPIVEERCDHYVKQTYRNRCIIATSDGPMALSIPVEGRPKVQGGDSKTPTGEMRISHHGRWRELHWNALVAAYERTPYFEYYADEFAAIYQKEHELLVDFNSELQQLVLRLLQLHPDIHLNNKAYLSLATDGTPEHAEDFSAFLPHEEGRAARLRFDDFREIIRPKIDFRVDPTFSPTPYYQVFASRIGFLPNMSIVDLLFNMGPESREVLRSSMVERSLEELLPQK